MEYYVGIEAPWERFNASKKEWEDWRWQLRNSITSSHELAKHVSLTGRQMEMIQASIDNGKKMRISPYYASLMGENPTGIDRGKRSVRNSVNSVFIQSVPTPAHYLFKAGVPDPMSEGSRSAGAAYQRYPDRVALMASVSSDCHMYCTHCQRGKDMQSRGQNSQKILDGLEYIRRNSNIREVLVTGGDALTLSDKMLEKVLSSLSEAGHVESIRIATRLPVTNPSSVTSEKLDIIAEYSKHSGRNHDLPNIYFMTHANAPEELTLDMQDAMSRIKRYGFTVRNQSVLLHGVNDDFERLSRLCRNLDHMGVDPYYLFQCHKVDGLAAEIVPINKGQYLVAELRGQEGISIPNYAVNMTGGGGKVILTPQGDKGALDFGYVVSREMRTWDNQIMEYEELLRVREEDYERGMNTMADFYGDPTITDYSRHESPEELEIRETSSEKFRPSFLVVDNGDPNKILYVTNATAPSQMSAEEKCIKFGLEANGYELGLSGQPYITNPSGAILDGRETIGKATSIGVPGPMR